MVVVIPAYKPDEKLPDLIGVLKNTSDVSVITVDDGGGKEYAPIFDEVRKRGCTVLVHEENRGKGAALKTAFAFIKENFPADEIICTADADGQHLPDDILNCLHAAENDPDGFIIGSRDLSGPGVPARSKAGNFFARTTFAFLMGKRVVDTQTGLRAFSASFLDTLLAVDGERYEYEMQVLCEISREKKNIIEIPIKTVYHDENKGSHFKGFSDAFKVYSILLKNSSSPVAQILGFVLSSGLATLVDISLYALAAWIFTLPDTLPFSEVVLTGICVLCGRVPSSILNYSMNMRYVFHNEKQKKKTFIMYVVIAVIIYCGNTAFTSVFVERGLDRVLSFVFSQCICFPFSFILQKFFVFKETKKD